MSEAKGKASMDKQEHHVSRKKQRTSDQKASKTREEDGKGFDEFVRRFKDNVAGHHAIEILKLNGQDFDPHSTMDAILEHCADQMVFGPLVECPDCGGCLQFAIHEYKCLGYISEWSKCNYTVKEALRKDYPMLMPTDKSDFLAEWEKEHDAKSRPVRDVDTSPKPFSGMHILLVGRLSHPQYYWKEQIEKLGGKVVHVVKAGISCVVVPEKEVSRGAKAKINEARKNKVPAVREPWLHDSVTKQEPQPYEAYEIGDEKSKENVDDQAKTCNDQAIIAAMMMADVKLPGKQAVHKDSELETEGGRVLEHEGIIYSYAFAVCDQTANINCYAVMQLVELPDGILYFYCKKGRIGDGLCTNERLDQQPSVSKALREFSKHFEELTGNEFEAWEKHKKFTKRRSLFNPIDMDVGIDARAGGLREQQLGSAAVHTKLDARVGKLLKCLFSQAVYRYAMSEMAVDSPEIPLGNLTEYHLKRCEECLLEFADFLNKGEGNERRHEKVCLDLSNRWFSLVPSSRPMVINDILQLTELAAPTLESLRDISVASSIIGDMTGATLDDPLSDRYSKLNCTITPVDKESNDYAMVQNYLEKTYEPVKYNDMSVNVVMEDLFTVDCKSGPKMEEVMKMSNKMLLWCGTRTCNMVRCVSKGLYPAIFQAPAPGYMFGRGLYYTDAACNSVRYGFTSVDRPDGILMLSVVALGDNVIELTKAEDDASKYEKEKAGIKGLGKKEPDEEEFLMWNSGVKVACGTLKPSAAHNDRSLDYNEYVVYDPKQVKLHFLVQVRYEETSEK